MFNLGIKGIYAHLNESEVSLGYFQTEAKAPYIARQAWGQSAGTDYPGPSLISPGISIRNAEAW